MEIQPIVETTAPGARPGPSAEALRIAADLKAGGGAKRGRGRPRKDGSPSGAPAGGTSSAPSGSAENPEVVTETKVSQWTDDTIARMLERAGRVGVKFGVPEWELPPDDRAFVAPYLKPLLDRFFPEPGRGSWIVGILVIIAFFGHAIVATIERAQLILTKAQAWLDKLKAMLKRRAAPQPAPGKPADAPAQNAAPGSGGAVLAPMARPEL